MSNCWKVIEDERDKGSVTHLLNATAEQLEPVFEELSPDAEASKRISSLARSCLCSIFISSPSDHPVPRTQILSLMRSKVDGSP